MFSKVPVITDTGKTLLLRAASGELITFTRFKAGNGVLGEGETEETMTALKSVQVANIPITKSVEAGEGYIKVTGTFNNQNDVENDFVWTELGLFARVDNSEAADYETEYLYAYGYDNQNAELIKAGGETVVLEQTVNLIVAIGTSGNITVDISEGTTFAKKADFDAHTADQNNPHHVTRQQLGAAASSHNHSASAITSGTLPVARGGTGVNTAEEMRALFAPVSGMYEGDGTSQRDISLGFQPNVVIYSDESGAFADGVKGTTGGIILRGYPHYAWNVGYEASRSDSLKVAEITSTGFRVYHNGSSGANGKRPNQNGIRYFYIAW